MATHTLKTWPNAWDAVADGRKRFEWRKDDRGFEVGDTLVLRKWDPATDGGLGGYVWRSAPHLDGRSPEYTEMRLRVTYILRGAHGVPSDHCVMGIELEPATGVTAIHDDSVLQELHQRVADICVQLGDKLDDVPCDIWRVAEHVALMRGDLRTLAEAWYMLHPGSLDGWNAERIRRTNAARDRVLHPEKPHTHVQLPLPGSGEQPKAVR